MIFPLKGAPNDFFFINDSEMHPHFEVHLLSLDTETEFPVSLPIFKEGRSY